MIVTRSRVKTAGWAAVLLGCGGAVAMLAFKVNAVRSEVRHAEEQIVQLERDNLYLETEFETRASQQQLSALNRMEFGYVAPGPGQFLPNERALASFGEPRAKGAPAMIRVARDNVADVELASFTGEVAAARSEPAPQKPAEKAAPKPSAKPAAKPATPTFQRAVAERTNAAARKAPEPTFAALFAAYRVDEEGGE